MLRVTVELVPGGYEADKFTVATAELWNMNRMTADRLFGDYGFKVEGDWEHFNQQVSTKVFETGVVAGFPRKSAGMWALLREALAQALPSVRLDEDYIVD